jgi:hypothetical protein
MYKPYVVFSDPPEPHKLLWRYMDWPGFFTLLKTKKLFFIPARLLQRFDPYEGSLPKKERDIYYTITTKEALKDGIEVFRRQVFASCWHYNETESVAMWQLYAAGGRGIAIQTSISDFKKAFETTSHDIYTGKVIYIDYETEGFYHGEKGFFPNPLVSFIHKRKIFQHEQEYRALLRDKTEPDGVAVDVDLRLLVQRVVVAPKTPYWQLEAVQLLLDDLLPGTKLERSIVDVDTLI